VTTTLAILGMQIGVTIQFEHSSLSFVPSKCFALIHYLQSHSALVVLCHHLGTVDPALSSLQTGFYLLCVTCSPLRDNLLELVNSY